MLLPHFKGLWIWSLLLSWEKGFLCLWMTSSSIPVPCLACQVTVLRAHKFYIKLSICSFARQEIKYLGHTISARGVSTEPAKLLAVEQRPTLTCLKELRGFLGLTRYYRKFIKHYGLISRPLSDLLKKEVPFVWTSLLRQLFSSWRLPWILDSGTGFGSSRLL